MQHRKKRTRDGSPFELQIHVKTEAQNNPRDQMRIKAHIHQYYIPEQIDEGPFIK